MEVIRKRGRPVKSEIRQHIIDILSIIGKAYGYQIHKIHNELYPPCTIENIYYHLKKGTLLREFEALEKKLEKGNYSWGSTVEKTYYHIGPNGHPSTDTRVKDYFEKKAAP